MITIAKIIDDPAPPGESGDICHYQLKTDREVIADYIPDEGTAARLADAANMHDDLVAALDNLSHYYDCQVDTGAMSSSDDRSVALQKARAVLAKVRQS